MSRFVPTTLRDWERILEPLNAILNKDVSGQTSITVDTIISPSLPAQDAAFVTLAPNATLGNERVLAGVVGEIALTDYGAGDKIDVGLASAGTAGTYAQVTTDARGRVVAGAAGLLVLTGAGSPEGAVTASVGALYTNTSGGAGTTLYVKESSSGNIGWIAK